MTTPVSPVGRAGNPPVKPGGLITCRPAISDADLAAHHAIRRAVFVAEQGVFDGSDGDRHDEAPGVVHLLGRYAGAPAGAVRLFLLSPESGVWQGDRLCVLPQYRTCSIAAPLVRCAAASAGARGGTRMVAHIQLPNVGFFTRLGWRTEGDTEIYVGLPHQPMSIELPPPEAGADIERELFTGIAY
ncbi:MAG TPA: MSMEG_0567/Sll0786 family nitrogen starvation N-acetyltransferase [Mycobacterium sp.]|nr:MSMEG_0567/Sll0786 family nitrogen starvation N-acetyltransferase [Mycobacterium sp.]